MSEVKTIFHITPVPAPRMVHSDKWSKRPVVLRYFKYRDELRLTANLHGYYVDPELSLTFIMPMPRSWTKKKKEVMMGQPHTTRPDLDNLLKAFKDALCGEDSFVHTYKDISKVWGPAGGIRVKTQLQEKTMKAQWVNHYSSVLKQ